MQFSEKQITITMSGAQWFAILARIVYSKANAGLFSAEGARTYNEAAGQLQKQLLAKQ